MIIIKKILIIFVLSVAVLLLFSSVALFFALKNFGDLDKYKDKIFAAVKESYGYSLYAEKITLKPALKPYLPVNVHHFMVYDPKGEKLFKSGDIYFKVKLFPVLKKKIEVYELELSRPVFELDTDFEGYPELSREMPKFKGFTLSADIKNLILKRYKFNISDGNNKYSLEGDRIDIKTSDIKNSVFLLTQGVLFQGKKELLNYDINFEVPSDFLKRSQKADFSFKKYIKANIKSENIALGKLKEIYEILFRVLKIKTPFSDYKISGSGSFDFNVESDFKTFKSKGRAEIKNCEVNHKTIPFSVKQINSKISFENNNINIETANALINGNPVTIFGKVNDKLESDIKFLAKSIELKNLIPLILKDNSSDFAVNSGLADIEAQLTSKNAEDYSVFGNVAVSKLSLSDKTKNSKLSTDKLNISFSSTPKTLESVIKSDNIRLNLEKQKINLYLLNMSVKYDDRNLVFQPSKIRYNNSLLDFSGEMKDVKTDKRNFDFIIKGGISAKELESELLKYFKFQSASKGKLPLEMKLSGDSEKTKISANLRADRDNYLSLLVIKELLNKPSLLNIFAELKGNTLKIENVSLVDAENTKGVSAFKLKMEKLKKVAVLSGIVNLKEKPTVEDLKMKIPESMTFTTSLFDGAEVSLKGETALYGELSNPKVKGSVVLNKLNLLKHNVLIRNTVIDFVDNIIRVNVPDLIIGNSQFNVVADVLPKFDGIITIKNANVSSSKLDLMALTQTFSDVKTSDIFPGFEVPLFIQKGSGIINVFEYDDIKLSDVTVDFSMKDNILYLKNINSNGFGGKIKGSVDFNFLMQILNLDITGNGINTNKLFQALTEQPTDLTGRTEFEAKLQVKGKTKEQQLKSLMGRAKFITNDGQLGVLGQFERYLQAQNLLHLGFDRTKWEDLYKAVKTHNTSFFRRAEGEIAFENGYIIIESFKTQGNIMSLLILGRYNLLNDLADLNIFGKISDEIFSSESFENPYVNDDIPDIISINARNPRGFKVNITGMVDNIRSINSFEWLSDMSVIAEPDNAETKHQGEFSPNGDYEKYPSFMDEI